MQGVEKLHLIKIGNLRYLLFDVVTKPLALRKNGFEYILVLKTLSNHNREVGNILLIRTVPNVSLDLLKNL